ncbi:MAG: deoxyhypusine synthase-like protein [Phycisphaerae bacterium]|nr:MAG: deoxyhypusine synthase [Planctomycetia bacterium]RIK71117.1 MAG: deoxyhypusine synthase [Planctomycetota bacterium]GJQ27433.1 MAG: deoxyhypusine synthase-like protein [Phycisphaerae bacterium]
MATKKELLTTPIEHIDITKFDYAKLVGSMEHMAYSSRDLHRAATIYNMMLNDADCGIILCMAGSLVSAGLKKVFADMVRNRMVDCIVSTGANLIDQDFFEGLGFKHYLAPDRFKSGMEDDTLRELHIDRIYDTFIDEDELRICDDVTKQIFDGLMPRAYSSRELLREFGRYLDQNGKNRDSILLAAYENDVPIFAPAFSDCSAGFGLVAHIAERGGKDHVIWDGGRDFYELTQLKIQCPRTGIFMIGGGVPKNFTQDVVVAAEILGQDVEMHRYAIQVTVADVRDGALSSSTLKEASSWGKVDTAFEQMVYSEATLAVPAIVGYGYGQGAWKKREARRWQKFFEMTPQHV